MLIFYKLYTNDDAQFLKKITLCSFPCNCQLYGQSNTLLCFRRSVQELTRSNCLLCHYRYTQENPSDYTYQRIKCMALCIQWTYIIILYYYRDCAPLCLVPACCILAVARVGSVLGTGISFSCKKI